MNTNSEERQVALFHEDIYDAIGTTIQALGGFKKVALMLWPDMKMESAYARLKASLDHSKPEKLSPSEMNLLIRKGREVECHAIMNFLGDDCLYNISPRNLEVERDQRMKEFVESVRYLKRIAEQLEESQPVRVVK